MAKGSSQDRDARYQQWLRFVGSVARAVEAGSAIPVGPAPIPFAPPTVSATTGQKATVLVCAPHPDDEALIGALPMRLHQETGARVVDCAITLGSNVEQRARRLHELESACSVLGFELIVPFSPSGFDNINPTSREKNPDEWGKKVQALRQIFDREQPDVVFAPHAEDFNTTHLGTHYLVVEALGWHLAGSGRGPLPLVETEFWHEMAEPNLMLGVTPETVALQLMATAEHGGEVTRNPYHLLQPCRLMNNVRRGSEVIGGQGAAACNFKFAELYRVNFMQGRRLVAPRPGGRIVGPREKIDVAWLKEHFGPREKN